MLMKHASLSLLTATVLLGGCSLAPDYNRPALPVPASLPADGASHPSAPPSSPSPRAVADIGWRDFFTEPRLESVIELALENNRDLRIALANVEQARALYRVERAGLVPSISADGTGTKQRLTQSQAALYGGDRTQETWSASIGAAWEIDLFGRIRNLSEAALEQFFATEENRKAAQISLVAETANAWLTLSADQAQLAVAEASLDAFKKTFDLTKARFEEGAGSAIDVRQAQTSYDAARAQVAALKAQVAQDRNALTLLAGTTVPADLLPAEGNARPATLVALPVGVDSGVLLQRPDVQAAEHQLIAANANIGAARAAFFPRISLTGLFGTASNDLSDLFKSGTGVWSFTPSISLPIFQGGANVANLRYSEATRDAAVANYEKAVQTAFREVADAIARRSTINEQLEAQESLAEAATDLYRMAEARYRLGAESFLTTLDAQRTQLSAQQSLITARLARDQNLVDLYRALGGGLN